MAAGGGGSTTKTYTITVEDTKNGTITPSTVSVTKGNDKTFTIQADKGYAIMDVLVDGKSVGKVETYTFKEVEEDHKIAATFEKEKVEATSGEQSGEKIENNSSGEVTPSGDVNVIPTSSDTASIFNAFEDIKESDWFYDSIKFAVTNRLFNGVSQKAFGPQINMTRGMLVTVLYRLNGEMETEVANFGDVLKTSYYTYAISWAAKNGIVNGVGNNRFAPDEPISREDLATIIARYISNKKLVIEEEETKDNSYKDASKIAGYAKESVMLLSQQGQKWQHY